MHDDMPAYRYTGRDMLNCAQEERARGQIEGAVAERARIRRELEEWLIGNSDPRDAGLINSRRIVEEIKRICPEEG